MNANSLNLEIDVERTQVEEAILSIFHTILFHRSIIYTKILVAA